MEQGKLNEGKLSRRSGKSYDKEHQTRDCEVALNQPVKADDTGKPKFEKATKYISVDMDLFLAPSCDTYQTCPPVIDNVKQDCLQDVELTPKDELNGRPNNFGVVVPGLFRSSFPTEKNFHYLESLNLKTILTLVEKDFTLEFQNFIKRNSITHKVVNMPGTKKADVPRDKMRNVLNIMLDKSNYPALIHCNQGKHRTGCVVAALRHVSGWETSSILYEYNSFAAPKARDCDIHYISNIHTSGLRNVLMPKVTNRPYKSIVNNKMWRMLFLAVILIIIFLGLRCFR